MPSLTFKWALDDDFGEFGWVPIDQPKFNASRGMGVAHDTLEHFDVASGTLEEELMAFGSIFYIRVQSGHLMERNPYSTSPGEVLAGDLSRFLTDQWYQGRNAQVIQTHPGRPRHLPDLESDLDESVTATMRMLADDLGDDAMREFRQANPNVRKDLRRWIRAGYWKCKAKYGSAPGWRLAEAFDTIAREVDALKHNDEGDELRVTVRLAKANHAPTVKVTAIRLEDRYSDDD